MNTTKKAGNTNHAAIAATLYGNHIDSNGTWKKHAMATVTATANGNSNDNE